MWFFFCVCLFVWKEMGEGGSEDEIDLWYVRWWWGGGVRVGSRRRGDKL